MIKQFLISATLLINLAAANVNSGRFRDPMYHSQMSDVSEVTLKDQGWSSQHWFSTRLDHFDHRVNRWFQLRYWTNEDKFDRETGPIVLYICGEWTCVPPSVEATAMAYGQNKKGILIALEHRYYGSSQPFSDWSTENLHWLNTTQALEDIHKFINYMKIVLDHKMDRKVMIVGGSYPGAVVAWYQHTYNDATIVWSSSGVIHAIDEFKMFDYVIQNSTGKSAGCKEKVKELTEQIDQTWASGDKNKTEEMLNTFGAENMNIVQGDFMFYIADVFTMGVQYGHRGEMCTNITSTDAQLDPLGNLAKYAKGKGVSVAQYDAMALRNETYDINLNLRQWTYQYCTEFAWFQVPNDEYPQRSPSINLTFWHDYCQRIFGRGLHYPTVDETNEEFGGLNNIGKRIYFFNAIEDPWQHAGMLNITDEAKHPDQRTWVIDAEFAYHCIDLSVPKDSDAQSLKDGRADAIKWLDQWYNATNSDYDNNKDSILI